MSPGFRFYSYPVTNIVCENCLVSFPSFGLNCPTLSKKILRKQLQNMNNVKNDEKLKNGRTKIMAQSHFHWNTK